jgi:hypothetical protein
LVKAATAGSVRLTSGDLGATLRIGLAMPQVVDAPALAGEAMAARVAADMVAICEALTEAAA